MRLSSYISKRCGVSRRFAKRAIAAGLVLASDGKPVNVDIEVDENSNYSLNITKTDLSYNAKDYHIKQMSDVAFLYKPPLMHTERHTPLDGLCLDDVANRELPDYKLITRLDYGADGIIVAIKNGITVIKERKTYLAWVCGADFPAQITGKWRVFADKRNKVKVERVDGTNNTDAEVMNFSKLDSRVNLEYKNHSLVRVELARAHRHQVRAVLANLGYPIVGDSLYGFAGSAGGNGDRIYLHCESIELNGVMGYSSKIDDFIKG
ncbi:RluA family pseudouridine synthase [Deferribacterales bacterium RsTz2092]|nr:pseudouridine synthase [Deferribacterales bacterium]